MIFVLDLQNVSHLIMQMMIFQHVDSIEYGFKIHEQQQYSYTESVLNATFNFLKINRFQAKSGSTNTFFENK